MNTVCESINEVELSKTSKGPFQWELFYEYWYQVTFVKKPTSLELQKEQIWGKTVIQRVPSRES